MLTHSNIKSAFNAGKWRLYKVRGLFSRSIYAYDKSYLAPTKGFSWESWPSPDMAMLFIPFGCTHPPPWPCPTLPAHAEPMSHGHCWIWHHEAEVSQCICASLVGKGL